MCFCKVVWQKTPFWRNPPHLGLFILPLWPVKNGTRCTSKVKFGSLKSTTAQRRLLFRTLGKNTPMFHLEIYQTLRLGPDSHGSWGVQKKNSGRRPIRNTCISTKAPPPFSRGVWQIHLGMWSIYQQPNHVDVHLPQKKKYIAKKLC